MTGPSTSPELTAGPGLAVHRRTRGDDVGMTFPQHPARVRVTLKGGAVGWLAQDPDAGWAGSSRWNLVDSPEAAGVWPWQQAVALEREVRQAWRQQYATAELVDEEESE